MRSRKRERERETESERDREREKGQCAKGKGDIGRNKREETITRPELFERSRKRWVEVVFVVEVFEVFEVSLYSNPCLFFEEKKRT